MTTQILEKRTSESLWYDIDCTDVLNPGETVSIITSVLGDEVGLTFGAPVSNTATVTYSDGRVAAIGKVIQVQISAGVVPAGKTSLLYTIRAKFLSSAGNSREATVLLNVTDRAS